VAIIGNVSASVLPPPEEWARLAPAPGSVVWRYASDPRLLLTAGYALVLQVAHPTVGAGVSEHSRFREDPWGRLLRTLDGFYGLVYGGPQAAAELGRRLRALHATIKGAGGRSYHALEPEAYAWVHATLAITIVHGHARIGSPLEPCERQLFLQQWLAAGRLLGVGASDLPADWPRLERYFDQMVRDRLEPTAAVDDVLDTLRAPGPPPPPWPLPLRAGWPFVGSALTHALALVTTGMLPPVLRERFGLSWSTIQQLELGLLARSLRATTPALPDATRIIGPGYLRWRRAAIK
jgi:uncharacterized protein (DUF2236 family)